ncbi:hypothetical protein DAPPUDRAFT_238327 [Daphnia pulex]|uniref:Uncharacterized protein n=1 Tax=Daphnia pulex TaxID=6669 RepID=E9G650_DAPPU|nr:hypothetical protein DAPPUDRAFT_238327 [Daphnia pulex]|eukprot:EFX85054.1 hypothetical protein DAPPUDRAFT_238327 [Daphnia pulex]
MNAGQVWSGTGTRKNTGEMMDDVVCGIRIPDHGAKFADGIQEQTNIDSFGVTFEVKSFSQSLVEASDRLFVERFTS